MNALVLEIITTPGVRDFLTDASMCAIRCTSQTYAENWTKTERRRAIKSLQQNSDTITIDLQCAARCAVESIQEVNACIRERSWDDYQEFRYIHFNLEVLEQMLSLGKEEFLSNNLNVAPLSKPLNAPSVFDMNSKEMRERGSELSRRT
jgi:hypothetical protein